MSGIRVQRDIISADGRYTNRTTWYGRLVADKGACIVLDESATGGSSGGYIAMGTLALPDGQTMVTSYSHHIDDCPDCDGWHAPHLPCRDVTGKVAPNGKRATSRYQRRAV